MSYRRFRLGRKAEVAEFSEVLLEGVPLVVEQYASEVKDSLGTLTTPAHARSVQSHAYEVANGALHHPGSDVQVLAA